MLPKAHSRVAMSPIVAGILRTQASLVQAGGCHEQTIHSGRGGVGRLSAQPAARPAGRLVPGSLRGQDARKRVDGAPTRSEALGPRHRDDLRGRPASERGAMTAHEAAVQEFLAQKRIAVAGVSRDNRHHPSANLIYRRLRKTGHDVFAVNPSMQSFEGSPCYPNLRSIPGGVGSVVIVTRPALTERIVQECREAGVRRVWMHQSMASGSSVSHAAVAYCRQNDIAVIAGGCPMM